MLLFCHAILTNCFGQVSEGLDFGDMTGRAVLITGLPFPPMKDPRVLLKMEYLNDLHSEKTGQVT